MSIDLHIRLIDLGAAALALLCPLALAADELALMNAERIGPLRIGQPAVEAERRIDCPLQRGPVQRWGADNDYHRSWEALTCGLTLDLIAAEPAGPWTLNTITLTRPSVWKTGRGIGLGSTEAEVLAAYGHDRNPEESQTGHTFVAGTVYGGLMFTFRAGRVEQIFLGAAAE